MTDEQRHAHNEELLAQCYGPFAERARKVIEGLELVGRRPRIAVAARSPEAQAKAVAEGKSSVRFSFHMARSKDGRPEALAIDLVDEDFPQPPNDQRVWPPAFRAFILWLAHLAASWGLETGAVYGLRPEERAAFLRAVATATEPVPYDGPIGWDSLHLEPAGGFTTAQAKAGRRPWPA